MDKIVIKLFIYASLMMLTTGLLAQTVPGKATISGTVISATDNQPLMGVGVLIEGSTNGTVTDVDGNFTITVPSADANITFSSLGYESKTFSAKDAVMMKLVSLNEENNVLQDAVVVGYGVQKKENLTGAISVVDSKTIEKRSNASLGGILQGTVPGLTVTVPSGRPGESADINIRGWNSINSGSPLVLVDGVAGSLERVNPSDVESISVLKDASASAIYGAQAAFGVVLITTKSGGDKDGKCTVQYNGRWGFSSPTTSTDWETRGYYSVYVPNLFMKAFSGQQQILYNDEDMAELWVRRNDKVENPARPWVVLDDRNDSYKYYANTDWWHYFFNDHKPSQNHNLSFRGGTKNVKYFLSGNFDSERGVFRINPDNYKKYNLRARVSFDVRPWLNVSNNTSFYSSEYTYPGLANMSDTFYKCTAGWFSYLVPMTPEGNYIYQTESGGAGGTILGNLANENFVNKNKTRNFTNTTELTLKPLKQLEIKGMYSYSNNNYYALNRSVNGTFADKTRMKTVLVTTDDNEDKLAEQVQTIDMHSVNIYATYSDCFKDAHNLKIVAGGQYESYYHKKLYADGYDLMSQELNDQNLVSADADGNKRTMTRGGKVNTPCSVSSAG